MDWVEKIKQQFGDKVIEDKQFSELTTLEIGGPIKAFIEVSSQDELIDILKFVSKEQIPFLIIGGGSNLLVNDNGVDLLVIKNNIGGIDQKENQLTVPSGTVLQDLVDYTIEHGLEGLHKMTGIPGTVGGAVYGNAAAYGQTISDYIINVTCFDREDIKTLSKTDCGFDYRTSNFKATKFTILEINFELPERDRDRLEKESRETLAKRLVKYPPDRKTPGSFFKNVLIKDVPEESLHLIPPERDYYGKIPAWFFLNEVGARGNSLRQIKIADSHGNTFMNLGEGTAEDFYKLAQKYWVKVKRQFGIELEPEVQLIGLPTFSND